MQPRTLRLFNSYSRETEDFQPADRDEVRIYSCGPTVYGYAHLGNLRAYVFADTLTRVLNWKGYDVRHVINITDVGHLVSDADEGEDKMETTAAREHRSVWDIAEHYTAAFKRDLERIHVRPPGIWAVATSHIGEMIAFAARITERGYTYVLEDGLYFDTSRVPHYGKLALLDVEGQIAGKRVAENELKRNPTDFAVWRFSPPDKIRAMEWTTPWGAGAPGWHLECSAMSLKYLGAPFDIHTGGIDHRQVHHVNEIAQNQAYLGGDEPGANLWMHNEFLVLRDEKMAKSHGKALRLADLEEAGIHPLVYRLFTLTASYRTTLEFSWDAIIAARGVLRRLLGRIAQLETLAGDLEWTRPLRELYFSRGASFAVALRGLTEDFSASARAYLDRFEHEISDDLGTPRALVVLYEVLDDTALPPHETLRLVAAFDLVFGLQLLALEPDDLRLRPAAATLSDDAITALLEERAAARAGRNFARADEIRKTLLDAGVTVLDSATGSSWEWIVRAPSVPSDFLS